MRICFIADSHSIHVRRIVAYFVRAGHTVFVLSTAERHADLPNATVTYALPTAAVSKSHHETAEEFPSPHRRSILRRSLARRFRGEHRLLGRRLIRISRLFLNRKECSRKIKGYSPHVIIVIRAFPEGLCALFCGLRGFVLRTAGSDISYYPKFPFLGVFIRKVLQKASHIITQSQCERDYIRQGMNVRNPIAIANIGTDISLFRPASTEKRSEYNLKMDSIIVVSNRNLSGFYNGMSVIEAFMHAKKQCPFLELLYINPSPIKEETQNKIKLLCGSMDDIHIIAGPIPQEAMAELLSCGNIWLSFSSVDGVPSSMLEAMSCGLVPIVGDIPQLREWIQDGHNGFVVPLTDVQGMANRIVELAKNQELLTTLSARCRKKICEEGSYEDNMERMMKYITATMHSSHQNGQ